MPDAAFTYRWHRPKEGVAIFRRFASSRSGGLRAGKSVAGLLDQPELVLAPAALDRATFEAREVTAKERSLLVREIELLDADDADALLGFVSRWGFVSHSPIGHALGPRLASDLALCFSPRDGELPREEPHIASGHYVGVSYESLKHARQGVRIYQAAVARAEKLARMRGDARREGQKRLRADVLDRLAEYGGAVRDPETLLPLIASPLATAWQHVADELRLGRTPLRCTRCGSAYTLSETDRRSDRPPRHCSTRCRVAAWRKQNPSKKTPRSGGRRGRKR